MSELKTLKDFKRYCPKDFLMDKEPRTGDFDAIVNFYDLKQEAIKSVKELQSDSTIISNGKAITEQGHESYEIQKINQSALILWIKYFFNITEEDLQ